jgi:hypothetical protein
MDLEEARESDQPSVIKSFSSIWKKVQQVQLGGWLHMMALLEVGIRYVSPPIASHLKMADIVFQVIWSISTNPMIALSLSLLHSQVMSDMKVTMQ